MRTQKIQKTQEVHAQTQEAATYSLWQLVRYFLSLGTLGFGGPVALVGYLIAGLPGASVAALGTFLPCYLLTIVPIRLFRKYGKRPDVSAFITGVTAAATGAITGAVVVLGRRTLTDLPTVLLALVTLGLLWKWKKVPEPVIVLFAAIVGFAVYTFLHR